MSARVRPSSAAACSHRHEGLGQGRQTETVFCSDHHSPPPSHWVGGCSGRDRPLLAITHVHEVSVQGFAIIRPPSAAIRRPSSRGHSGRQDPRCGIRAATEAIREAFLKPRMLDAIQLWHSQ